MRIMTGREDLRLPCSGWLRKLEIAEAILREEPENIEEELADAPPR
ncbi:MULTISPECIES: hypothetical protein [Methanosarcina]|nr:MULTISPECIES: hypothetical protein [Methanosarcina]